MANLQKNGKSCICNYKGRAVGQRLRVMQPIAESVSIDLQSCRAVCGRRPLNRKAINPNSGSGHCFTSLRTTILVFFPGPRSYDLL